MILDDGRRDDRLLGEGALFAVSSMGSNVHWRGAFSGRQGFIPVLEALASDVVDANGHSISVRTSGRLQPSGQSLRRRRDPTPTFANGLPDLVSRAGMSPAAR